MKLKLCLGVLALVFVSSVAFARDVVDSQWVIASGSAQWESFKLAAPTEVSASVNGVQDTAKGFRVRLVNAEDARSCGVAGGTCRELSSWRQPRTTGFTHTETVPAGEWAFLVENSENLLKRMTVQVKLSVK